MRMKYGKVVFGYRDTFDMDATLKPIIHDAIVKFRDTLVERNNKGLVVGVPILKSCSDVQLMEYGSADFDGWINTLNKIIYSFGSNEPNIMKYDVDFQFEDIENNRKTTSVNNEVAYEQFKEDCKIHEEKVKEGLNLFAEYYQSLWW